MEVELVHVSDSLAMDSASAKASATVSGTGSQITKKITNLSTSDASKLSLSFGGCGDLLRASRLTSVLHCGAAILAGNDGSAASYDLSERVAAIDTFVSHNWSTSRWQKFFCLALHFSFHYALLLSVVLVAVIGVATALDLLPSVTFDDDGFESGVCGTLLVAPFFLSVVCLGHGLRYFGCNNLFVFLDKTCIHQSDTVLQLEGIAKLGAFVQCSSHMVVIYTDIYLKKLWTVYEVACFLSLHPTSKLYVVSDFLPWLPLGGVIILWAPRLLGVVAYAIVGMDFRPAKDINISEVGYIMVVGSLMSFFVRRYARSREATIQRLVSFKVEECECAVEEDRPRIYRNIALLMRATDAVSHDATSDEVREAFNRMVRRRLPGPLLASASVGYWHCFAVHFCGAFPAYFDMFMGPWPIPAELGMRARLISVIDLLCWSAGVMPAMILFGSVLARHFLHFTGWREAGYMIFLCLWATVFCSTFFWAISTLRNLAIYDDDALLGLTALILSLMLLATAGFAYENRPPKSEGAEARAQAEVACEDVKG